MQQKKQRWLWGALAALPLAVGGLVYAGMQAQADKPAGEQSFVCPITGEQLPCPKCCPLN